MAFQVSHSLSIEILLTYLISLCDFPPHLRKTIHKIDITYYCAILLPHVDADRFRIVCDWMNWVSR